MPVPPATSKFPMPTAAPFLAPSLAANAITDEAGEIMIEPIAATVTITPIDVPMFFTFLFS